MFIKALRSPLCLRVHVHVHHIIVFLSICLHIDMTVNYKAIVFLRCNNLCNILSTVYALYMHIHVYYCLPTHPMGKEGCEPRTSHTCTYTPALLYNVHVLYTSTYYFSTNICRMTYVVAMVVVICCQGFYNLFQLSCRHNTLRYITCLCRQFLI